MFNATKIDDGIARAQKKLAKGQLTRGALSLIYGLYLLIEAKDDLMASNDDRGNRRRALALRAISLGLRDLGPSAKVREEPIELMKTRERSTVS